MAIPLAEATRARLHGAAQTLRDAAPELRWVPPDRLHLTVKFLGGTPEATVPMIVSALRAVAQCHPAVPVVLRAAGAFPTLRTPAVVWAGVDPAPRLELLQHDVEAAMAGLGFPLEGRAFRPHVTLARIKAPLAPGPARALRAAVRRFGFESEEDASSLDLMQSSLTERGPGYRCVASAPLRAG